VPLAFLLLSSFVVLLLARLRYPGEALRHAAPFAAPAWAWDTALALLAAGAAVAAFRARRVLARPGAARALSGLAVYPLGLAIAWGVLPAYPGEYALVHKALVVGVAVLMALLVWRGRASLGLTWRGFGGACRALALPTATLLGLGLVFAATQGLAPRWERLAANLVAYPVYASLQLLVLLVYPVRLLERLSDSRPAIVLASAGLFALVHWPNGPLVLGCLAGAAVWARSFLRHGNLAAIAISMGVLAAVLMNVAPRDAIHNARCGPIYVQRLVERPGPP
jgi:hypothetical protein